MAVAIGEQSQGGLCIGVALQPLLEGCDRRVELPQGNPRLSQIMERDIPIERIKPHTGIDRFDACRGVAAEGQNATEGQMSSCEIGCQGDAASRLGKRPIVLAMPCGATAKSTWASGSSSFN